LFSSFDRPRRRFVQDGEVPVTVIHPRPRQGLDALGPPRAGASPQERAEAAEAALGTERAAREQAERLLREAQATILDLRTKQGHAELARAEADEIVAALRADLAATQGSLAAAQEALASAPAPGVVAPVRGRRKARRFWTVAPDADDAEAPDADALEMDEPDLDALRAVAASDELADATPIAAERVAAPAGDAWGADDIVADAPAPPVRRGRGRPRIIRPELPATDPTPKSAPAKAPALKSASPKAAPRKVGRPKAAAPGGKWGGAKRPVAKSGAAKPGVTKRAAAKPKAAVKAPARSKPVKWWIKSPAGAKAAAKPAAGRRRSPRSF
jgi:hypothetical protein